MFVRSRYSASRITEPELAPETIGRDNVERWHTILERAYEVRRHREPARFYDMDFREFVRDPVAEVERIYHYFDLPLSIAALGAMRTWHQNRPRNQYGDHRYDAAQFGLDEDTIRERFAHYRARHGME